MTRANKPLLRAIVATIGLAGLGLASHPASAQDDLMSDLAGDSDHLYTDMGVGLMVGGGAGGFTDDEALEVTESAGGTWEARAVVGTRTYVGGELAYVGSAWDLEDDLSAVTSTGDIDPYMAANGGEALLRVQAPVTMGFEEQTLIEPFLAGGINVSGYTVASADLDETIPQREIENETGAVTAIPLGAGIGLGHRGLLVDTRATWRPSVSNDFLDPADENALGRVVWTADVGVEL